MGESSLPACANYTVFYCIIHRVFLIDVFESKLNWLDEVTIEFRAEPRPI